MNLESVNRSILEKPPLEFGAIFSASIELFKKVWIQGFITLLLTFVTILPFYIMIYIPMITVGITDPEFLRSEEPPTMVVIGMLILIPVFFVGILTFGLALNAAFMRICKQKDEDASTNDDYFYFFKQGRLGKVFMLALLMLGLIILGMLACGIGIVYLVVPLSLIPAFLAFNEELSAIEIVKASVTLGNRNWLVIFGLVIVMGLLAEFGIILCCIGILFTAMLAKVPAYYIYKAGVGFKKKILD